MVPLFLLVFVLSFLFFKLPQIEKQVPLPEGCFLYSLMRLWAHLQMPTQAVPWPGVCM